MYVMMPLLPAVLVVAFAVSRQCARCACSVYVAQKLSPGHFFVICGIGDWALWSKHPMKLGALGVDRDFVLGIRHGEWHMSLSSLAWYHAGFILGAKTFLRACGSHNVPRFLLSERKCHTKGSSWQVHVL